jgi:hypothetical protein
MQAACGALVRCPAALYCIRGWPNRTRSNGPLSVGHTQGTRRSGQPILSMKSSSNRKGTFGVLKLTPPARRGSIGGLYAAKLLFEFRVLVNGHPGVRRLCEERLVLLQAMGAREALREAKRQGRLSQHSYRNGKGDPVHFQFVGVMDLLHLGAECGPNEVRYTVSQRVRPMERRRTILPREGQLNAIREEGVLLGPKPPRPPRK